MEHPLSNHYLVFNLVRTAVDVLPGSHPCRGGAQHMDTFHLVSMMMTVCPTVVLCLPCFICSNAVHIMMICMFSQDIVAHIIMVLLSLFTCTYIATCLVPWLVHTFHSVPNSCTLHSVPSSCTLHSVPNSCTLHSVPSSCTLCQSVHMEVPLIRSTDLVCPVRYLLSMSNLH